jgi:hypothetical protein
MNTALQVGKLQVRTTHGTAHTVAYYRLAPLHPSLTTSLATCRPCSRTEKLTPQPKVIPIHQPRRDERLGRSSCLRLNTLPKDVMNWPRWQGLDSNPGLSGLESSVLTTRPRCAYAGINIAAIMMSKSNTSFYLVSKRYSNNLHIPVTAVSLHVLKQMCV